MKKHLRVLVGSVLLTTTLLLGIAAKSQQSLIQVNGWNAYVHLPSDYSTSKVYPTIIEFPGLGEVGTNASLVIEYGPGAYITQGWNGNIGSVEFIVISLQPAASYPAASLTNTAIASLKALYKIDPSNLFLTGYSEGGWCSSMFVSSDPVGGPYTYASQVKAICTIEGVRPDDNADYPNGFIGFAKSGGKDLCMEQINDGRDGGTIVNEMNSTVANSAQFYQTDFGAGGHCCWSNFYGGGGTAPGIFPISGTNQTIYQWFASLVNPTASTTPVISSAVTATGKISTAFSYTITASNTPTSYTASGLPTGLSVNASTGVISGTPTTSGTFNVSISATNASGKGSATLVITVNPANIPPVANAGANIIANLPGGTTLSVTTTVTLSGSGTDADGTIASYKWAQLSGPVTGTIASSTSASTTVSALTMGVYQFTLTVTDNAGAIGKDTVQITVNEPPSANAGADQLISLPATTVTLSGSGTDADGTIASYKWTKASGPTAGTITSATSASTTVTSLAAGVYKFALTVTDNNGATGTDTMQVTVNTPPVANAGADQTIKLPTSTITLSGSGTDANGTIASYKWVKASGPTAGTIASATSASSTVTGLTAGVYKFVLTVTDNNGATGTDTMQVTVNAANIPPVANAGADQTIKLPTSTITLSGSGTDADGTIASYKWVKASGPTAGTITSATSASTTVTSLAAGVYKFVLTVTDNAGATGTDTIQVTVNAANIPPVANAGADQTIKLPTTTITLSGSGTDADGTIASYKWAKASGPTAGTITSATSASSTVTSLAAGIYKFVLTVTDNAGATGTDTIQVTVNAANIPPVANAGADQTIKLPTSTITLSGSGTDADGTIASYKWAKASGPAAGTITSATSASSTVTSLAAGIYKFVLTVTDNGGATSTDTMQVTVNAANIPPVANAGTDQTIKLPTTTITLSGSGTDADGTIASYKWAKASGPTAGTITSATSASTTVTSLAAGVYKFVLTVTDNAGATGTDTMQVTVNAANIPPVANAGVSQSVTLPTNSVTLNGSGTDADGTIASYKWAQASGPAAATISSSGSAITTVTGLVTGVYQFTLTVTDNNGGTASASTQVTVNAAVVNNQPLSPAPIVSAGNHNNLTWALTTDKTVAAVGPVNGGLMLPGANFPNPGTHNKDGYKCAIVSGDWPTVATAGYNIDFPLLPGSGIDLTVMGLTFTAKTSGSSGSNLFSLAYQVDGAGSWIPFGTVQTALSGATTNIVFGALNQLLLKGHTYTVRLYIYSSIATTTTSRNVYIKSVALTGKSALDISLPTNSVTLNGSATDSAGTITSYLWTKISGPTAGTITAATSATTTVTGLTQGVYKFVLAVTNSTGAIGRDTIQVTVNATGSRPAVTAANITINDVQIYPNPVQNVLTAKVSVNNANQKETVLLTDLSGRVLYKNELSFTQQITEIQIDMSHFNRGIYLLTLNIDGQNITRKVVKN